MFNALITKIPKTLDEKWENVRIEPHVQFVLSIVLHFEIALQSDLGFYLRVYYEGANCYRK